ncbi:MAG: hypothetical protein AB8H79_22740 [Myxococcota bacterium]
MIIFNLISMLEVAVGAAIGAAIAGLLHLMGLDFTFWFVVLTMGVAAPLDGLWRLAQSFGDEEGATPMNMVLPGGGGHLFFLPVWLVGAGVAVAAVVYG